MVKYIFLLLLMLSCTNESTKSKSHTIGEINGNKIYTSDIDNLIQQELFDLLNKAYSIKSKAFEAYIDIELLNIEARKYNLSVDQYIESFVSEKIKTIGYDSLYHQYKLDSRVKIHGLNISIADKESLDEKLNFKYNIKSLIINTVLDSLKINYNIKKFIYPPKSPNIDLSELLVYYRGNLKSDMTCYIISDFDCNKCIENHAIYDSLYTMYKNDIKFGYINFSSTPTLSQLACNAANKQNKFWIYHDSLYNQTSFVDSTTVFRIANNIGLNMNKFNNDLRNSNYADEINNTIEKLVNKGIFATPTIIINKRIIYNSASFDEICNLINTEIKK